MKRHVFVLLACLFVVMIGFGITLPVLPFYVERLALDSGASQQAIVLHVTLLTSVYALMQLVFAPLWGRWSDRIGRRPLILVGIGGYVVAQIMFGLSTSLWLLYVARIVGGALSSATLPVSAAYVVDMTTKEERSRGMAWLGTAESTGPAMLGAQLFCTYAPIMNRLFRTAPIDGASWLRIVGVAAFAFVAVELEKWIRFGRRSGRSTRDLTPAV